MNILNMEKRGKRAQVTIFIIIAIAIVALALLIYFLYPKIIGKYSFDVNNPNAYLQNCLSNQINEASSLVKKHGGSINPELVYSYQNIDIEYLCYTDQYYLPCIVQRPLLSSHVAKEIKNYISPEASACMDSLKSEYESKGYIANLKKGDFNVDFLPGKLIVKFNSSLTVSSGESRIYKDMQISVNNDLYSLLAIATNIIQWETHYGDAETTAYMSYYRDIKVEKKKQSDGTTVYILTNRQTGGDFTFASKSVVWPPGYGNLQ